jgi:glycosyltransferase involved in cell wall biosynthesis
MRIALLAPAWYPIPPEKYGGLERVVAWLADGLAERGHEVTLFASGDSSTKASLSFVYPEAPTHRIGYLLPELNHAMACLEQAEDFDVISDHTGLTGASLSSAVATPIVHTIHFPVQGEAAAILTRAARMSPRLRLLSLSLAQRRAAPRLPWVATCPNGIDVGSYPLSTRGGEYLAFLGRMNADKGPHHAIRVARKAGMPLRIAAKAREPWERAFFEQHVRPHLGAGVEYLGEIGHEEKVELLGGAAATLFPIDWEEPCGLVPLESMACGTPVIATRRGAVPEIVEDGRTGFVVNDVDHMPSAVGRIGELDRAACRQHVEARFSAARMVAGHEAVYERLVQTAMVDED